MMSATLLIAFLIVAFLAGKAIWEYCDKKYPCEKCHYVNCICEKGGDHF